LKNSVRVATEEGYGETATVGVFIDAGSAYENTHNNGVAHFLEHMAFKGTKNRSRVDLEVEIENMGGHLNAYTSREQTVYYAQVFKQDVPRAVEILSDIIQNSLYSEENIEAERSTILREMEEVNQDNSEVIFDHLHGIAFQGSGLARTILGPEDNIKSIKRPDLVNYVNTYYTGNRIVLAASGGVKHEDIVALGEKHFSGLASGNKSDPKLIVASNSKPTFTGGYIEHRDDSMDQLHLAVAVEGVGWDHPDYFTFMLVQTIIGSWEKNLGGGKNLGSRLAEIFATEAGGAVSFTCFNTCYRETGLFGVYLVLDKDSEIEDPLFEAVNEWSRIGKTLTETELERAKSKLKAQILVQLDGTTPVCEDIGRQVLTYGRRLPPAEVFERINRITVKDVMRVMSEHCEDADPAIVAIGPTSEMPDYLHMRRFTYWSKW
jgi:processing peptidase subunit beta